MTPEIWKLFLEDAQAKAKSPHSKEDFVKTLSDILKEVGMQALVFFKDFYCVINSFDNRLEISIVDGEKYKNMPPSKFQNIHQLLKNFTLVQATPFIDYWNQVKIFAHPMWE